MKVITSYVPKIHPHSQKINNYSLIPVIEMYTFIQRTIPFVPTYNFSLQLLHSERSLS